MSLGCGEWGLCLGPGESQGKTTKARSPQGLTQVVSVSLFTILCKCLSQK